MKKEQNNKTKRIVVLIDENPTTKLPKETNKKTVKIKITEPSRAPYTKYINLDQSQINKLQREKQTEKQTINAEEITSEN